MEFLSMPWLALKMDQDGLHISFGVWVNLQLIDSLQDVATSPHVRHGGPIRVFTGRSTLQGPSSAKHQSSDHQTCIATPIAPWKKYHMVMLAISAEWFLLLLKPLAFLGQELGPSSTRHTWTA